MVEENGGDDEEAEEEDLDAEAGEDDVFTEFLVVEGFDFGEEAATWGGSSVMFSSVCVSRGGQRDGGNGNLPAPCAKKDSTSPVTNTLVIQLVRINAYSSALSSRIKRPRIM